MKRADFDAVLREFEPRIRDSGFTGTRGTYRLSNGVRFKFVLNKYGWDPDLGWGFLLDVQDTTREDEWGVAPAEARMQIKPHSLEKDIGKKTLMALYAGHPRLRSQLENGWFVFDDVNRLRTVLATVLEPALTHIRSWSEAMPPK